MAYSKWRNIYSRKSTRSWKEQQVCDIRTAICFPSTPFSQFSGTEYLLPAGVAKKDSTPSSLPSSQSRALVSAQEVQATSISHSFQLCVADTLFQASTSETGGSFLLPSPTCRVEALPQHKYWIPSPPRTDRVSQIRSLTADCPSERVEARRLWDNIFKALKEKLNQGSYI